MPTPETMDLHQKAVLWEVVGRDNKGQVTLEAAVEINTRRQLKRRESPLPTSGEVALDGWLAVDREISEGAIIWFGELDDVPDDTSTLTNLKQVVTDGEIPDLKARHFRRTVGVIKYHNTLPSLAS